MRKYINNVLKGDCLTFLKKFDSNFFDIGITSPPYNKQEKHQGWLVKNVKYDSFKDAKKEDIYQQEQIDVLNEIFRVTKEGGSFFYNHKIRWDRGRMIHPMEWLLKTKWTIKQEIVWDRVIAANIRGWRFWQIDERIYWLYKPVKGNEIGKELESKCARLTSIWRFLPEDGRKNPHPAPFPLTLPTRIIASLLGENKGVVLDPYCGSGTTLVAASLLKQKFIGIEHSAEYVSFAKKRLKSAELESSIVQEELKKHVIKRTFKQIKIEGGFTGRHRRTNIKKPKKPL